MGRSCLSRVQGRLEGQELRTPYRGGGSLLCGPACTPGDTGTWNLTFVPLSQPLTLQMARYKDPLAGSCRMLVSPYPNLPEIRESHPPGDTASA